MIKESTRPNRIAIIVSIVLVIVTFIIALIVFHYHNSQIIAAIVVGIVSAAILVIVFSARGIVRKVNTNRALDRLDYNYNYLLEHEIYKRVGRTRRDRITKKIEKEKIVIPPKYTEWKKGLIERNQRLKDNEDFFHYLKKKARNLKNLQDTLAVIVTPLYVATFTLVLSSYFTTNPSKIEIILAVIPCYIGLMTFLTIELITCKNELFYVEDIIEILCPKYCNK